MYMEKENISLYYEVYGEGEPLLLVHGVIVDADLYQQTAKYLSKYYRVIIYDRRGNSRSICRKEKGFHMEEQVEDIRNLMDMMGIEKASIVGASAGATIGQCFLQKYPDRVIHLIMYEPAMLGLVLESDNEFRNWVEEMKNIIKKRKYSTALLKFSNHIGIPDPRSPQKPEDISLREMENVEYALTVEIPGLLVYRPNIDWMRENAEKITIVAGEKSGNTVYVRTAIELSEQIGKKAVFYPGGHNLPYDLPKEFAICVLGTFMLSSCH